MIITRYRRVSGIALLDGYDLGVVIEGDHRDLAVVASEPQRGLVAVRRLPPHLDAADGPVPLAVNRTLDRCHPTPMADAHLLHHADALSGRVFRLRRRGNHRTLSTAGSPPLSAVSSLDRALVSVRRRHLNGVRSASASAHP